MTRQQARVLQLVEQLGSAVHTDATVDSTSMVASCISVAAVVVVAEVEAAFVQ